MSSKDKSKILKFFEFIMWTYVIIGSIVLIYFLLLKLIGHSPTTDTIMLTMLSVILAGLIGGGLTLGIHIGRFNEFMRNSNQRFESLLNDFKEHLKNHKK